MRFFVPLSNDSEHGEHLYKMLRDRLGNTKEALADTRIHVLKFQQEGKRLTIAVGDDFHRLADGPVMAILQGAVTSTYYVCTPKHGGFEGEPYPIQKEAGVEIEEFSALC